ncbi:hypothetical protein [Flavobacterium sp.]|uniref:hypothetical protein n=1 Tax=Flavobacterium sp. TaxID=239 RepID=UPI0026282A2B|nr:hypothetical protein [Flavobacterium sp.]
MKTIKFSISCKQVILILSVLFLAISLASCSKKTVFNTSSIIPAARGEVKVKEDKNNNYKIELQISYLAEPERLNPPRKTYVVWMKSDDYNAINLGQIVGSSKLHVKFETVSSSKPKKIFITAEDDASVQYPSYMIVLETDNL